MLSLIPFAFLAFFHADEIMQQEIRPLVAVDIIEQLHRQFAILSGKDWTSVVSCWCPGPLLLRVTTSPLATSRRWEGLGELRYFFGDLGMGPEDDRGLTGIQHHGVHCPRQPFSPQELISVVQRSGVILGVPLVPHPYHFPKW